MRSGPIAICVGWSAGYYASHIAANNIMMDDPAAVITTGIITGIVAALIWWQRDPAQ